jgi:hypothetical protein
MGKKKKKLSTDAPKRKPGRPSTGITPMRSLRIPDVDWNEWQAIAEQNAVPLTQWLITVCRKAAKRAKGNK